MNRDRMTELLQSLPRDGASEFFTPRVMAAIRAPRRRTLPRGLRWGAAVAGVSLAVLTTFFAAEWRSDRAEQTRLAVRSEQQSLEAELEALKDLANPDSTSMLYVGSAGEYDYFIDLRALEEKSAATGTRNVQLANYQPGI